MPGFPERRYAAAPEFTIPDLAAQDLVESIETTTGAAEDTRYDTTGSHLERAGMDLYRRKDADGAAWYLCVRAEAEVMAFDSKATTPPREASTLLTGVRAGQRLVMAERVLAEWDSHRLLDEAGEVVATIHDTLLTRSHPAGDVEPEVWRELEVVYGAAVTKGARKSLDRLLRSLNAEQIARSRVDRSGIGLRQQARGKGLRGLVDAYLQDQLRGIASGDFRLRRDGDSVHDTRVAIRRLRSTLHVFDDVLDAEKAAALSDELSWFAAALGQVRDADVAGRRVEQLLEAAPDSLDVSAARRHADQRAAAAEAAGYEALATVMSSRRYSALVATLEEWRVDAPFLEAASQPRKAARGYVTKTQTKLRKRLRAATRKRADLGDLHDARKAAKRLRYAAELSGPTLPKGGAALDKEGRRWQRRLGEMQDLRITAELLRDLGRSAPTMEEAFVFGALWDQVDQSAVNAHAVLARKVR